MDLSDLGLGNISDKTLRAILSDIEKESPAIASDLKRLKVQRIKFALSKAQRIELLEQAKTNRRLYLIIRLQLETGMRISEIAHLRIEMLNFQINKIYLQAYSDGNYIDHEWGPKTKKSNRIIPISPNMADSLKKWVHPRTSGYVFVSQKRRHYRRNSLINAINIYAKRCPSIRMSIGSHALRRTYASFLLSKKVRISKISKVLGHKSIKITLHYLFDIVSIEEFEEITEAIMFMNEDPEAE